MIESLECVGAGISCTTRGAFCMSDLSLSLSLSLSTQSSLLSARQAELEQLKWQFEQLEEDKISLDALLTSRTEQLQESQDQLGVAQEQLQESQDQLLATQQQLQESQEMLRVTQEQLQECQDQLRAAQDARREVEERLHQAEMDVKRKEIEARTIMSDEVALLQKSLAEKDALCQGLNGKLTELIAKHGREMTNVERQRQLMESKHTDELTAAHQQCLDALDKEKKEAKRWCKEQLDQLQQEVEVARQKLALFHSCLDGRLTALVTWWAQLKRPVVAAFADVMATPLQSAGNVDQLLPALLAGVDRLQAVVEIVVNLPAQTTAPQEVRVYLRAQPGLIRSTYFWGLAFFTRICVVVKRISVQLCEDMQRSMATQFTWHN